MNCSNHTESMVRKKRRTRFQLHWLHHFYLLLVFLGPMCETLLLDAIKAVSLFFSRSVFVSCFHMEVRRNGELGRQFSAIFFMKMKYVLWYFCCSWPKRTTFECHLRIKPVCICASYVYGSPLYMASGNTRIDTNTHTPTLVRARNTNTENIRPQIMTDMFWTTIFFGHTNCCCGYRWCWSDDNYYFIETLATIQWQSSRSRMHFLYRIYSIY